MCQKQQLLIFYVICIFFPKLVQLVDYCSKNCTNKKDVQVHTICKRGGCHEVPGCHGYYGKKHNFRKVMLDAHNHVRSLVAMGKETRGGLVGASNMKAVSYDFELEYVIQCYLYDCIFEHDKCRWTEKYAKVGQNLWWSNYDVIDDEQIRGVAVKGWFVDELQFMKGELIDSWQFVEEAGHLTQMLWAETEAIGCARAKDKTGFHVACNYGPRGNTLTLPMYKKGAPCSGCGALKCNPKWPGLCGEDYLPPESVDRSRRSDSNTVRFVIVLALIIVLVL